MLHNHVMPSMILRQDFKSCFLFSTIPAAAWFKIPELNSLTGDENENYQESRTTTHLRDSKRKIVLQNLFWT